MITFEHVTKRYGERLALDSVSWHMDEGECVVFLGPSGAGKTSILRLITHEISPTSGRVTVGTFRSGRISRSQRALLRRTLGIVYEDFRLLHDRTVYENVALAVRILGRFATEDVAPRVRAALDEVGLADKELAFPSELSNGEKQRAAIARAIVNRPAVLLADEPTGALEKRSADYVLDLLRRIHGEGAALVLVTTNPAVAAQMDGYVHVVEDGKLGGNRPSGEPAFTVVDESADAGPAPGPNVSATAGATPGEDASTSVVPAPPPEPAPSPTEGAHS